MTFTVFGGEYLGLSGRWPRRLLTVVPQSQSTTSERVLPDRWVGILATGEHRRLRDKFLKTFGFGGVSVRGVRFCDHYILWLHTETAKHTKHVTVDVPLLTAQRQGIASDKVEVRFAPTIPPVQLTLKSLFPFCEQLAPLCQNHFPVQKSVAVTLYSSRILCHRTITRPRTRSISVVSTISDTGQSCFRQGLKRMSRKQIVTRSRWYWKSSSETSHFLLMTATNPPQAIVQGAVFSRQ